MRLAPKTDIWDLQFGIVNGVFNGVYGYACSGDLQYNYSPNYVYLSDLNMTVYSGVKWQCVEYARRYLIMVYGVTFESVDNAFNIWENVTNVTDLATN